MRKLLIVRKSGKREILILENFSNIYTMDYENSSRKMPNRYSILFNTPYIPNEEINTILDFPSRSLRDYYFESILNLKNEKWLMIKEEGDI